MSKRFRHLLVFLLALAVLSLEAGPAAAHPHVWVAMKAELVYAPDGSLIGVRHTWTFDDMYSVFATQGIEQKKKGEFTREELAPLAELNVTSLKEFDYFTFGKVNGKKAEFKDPTEYYLDYKDELLTLHFLLPFKAPVKAHDVGLEVYDPSYFVDFSFVEKDPVAMTGAPAACKLSVARPQEMDAALSQRLAELSRETQLDPSAYLGAQFASKISVKCP